MSEGFSFNREFDFVRLDGLRRATGRPPHEWDLYIVKELVDNALDADDTLWQSNPKRLPQIKIQVEYIRVPERRATQLFVRVSNRGVFPLAQIDSVFSTRWYTSRKAFIKGLTRGALGNALKTLLGIPYALRNRVASDWKPELKPLSISCEGKEFLPRYIVDSTSQTISFQCDKKRGNVKEGTVISVGLDHFDQEVARTLAEFRQLAVEFHLCNPHADFDWTIEIDGKQLSVQYSGDVTWQGKFRRSAPVQWYSPAAFQDLLGAIYREQCGDGRIGELPVETIYSRFSGLHIADGRRDHSLIGEIINDFGKGFLAPEEIEGPNSIQLYRLLIQRSSRFASSTLGAIGEKHITNVLMNYLPIEGKIFYDRISDPGDDPTIPFVIEVAVGYLTTGKRQILTAINYTPSYSDPFQTRWMRASVSDQPVLGLRGILDAYDVSDNTPFIMFLHLICPTIEHHEFSKTEINHLPFKELLGDLVDQLITEIKRVRQEEELRLEHIVFETLDRIIKELTEGERFVFEQLLEKLRIILSEDPKLAAWLNSDAAPRRLQAFVEEYQNRNSLFTQCIARPAVRGLSIPLHPDRHFLVSAEYVSHELLSQHHVNKILYIQVPELEPIIIENGWLCRLDMALLHNPSDRDELRDVLTQCVVNSHVLVFVLHNDDDEGHAIIKDIRTWLKERYLDLNSVVDLGLNSADRPDTPGTKLIGLMPNELLGWIKSQLTTLGVPIKSVPSDIDLRRAIRERFEHFVLGHIWEGIAQQFEVARLINELDFQTQFTEAMIVQELDKQIKTILNQDSCSESYDTALNEIVGTYFKSFMSIHGNNLYELIQKHITMMIPNN